MKKILVSLVSLAALTLVGCASPSMIEAKNVERSWRTVASRHDVLVMESSLSEAEKQVALRTTAELIAVLDEALSTK